ncbi:MAG: OsmC family protein [Flavitalea sp.]
MKYLLEHPVKGKLSGEKHRTEITWRNGSLITDEPETFGGKDAGPDPFTLLLSSLVACTIATLRMYIEYKRLDIQGVEVSANMYQRIVNDETITHVERKISFFDQPPAEIQERLIRIAENCPVSKILKGNIKIITAIGE